MAAEDRRDSLDSTAFRDLAGSTLDGAELLTSNRTHVVVLEQRESPGGADATIVCASLLFASGCSLPAALLTSRLSSDALTATEARRILAGRWPLSRVLDPDNDGRLKKRKVTIEPCDLSDDEELLQTDSSTGFVREYDLHVLDRCVGHVREVFNEQTIARLSAGPRDFRTMIEDFGCSRRLESCLLSDPLHACGYAELDARLDAIDSFLKGRGVQECDVVTLRCRNSVTAALTILALLRGNYSFHLSPALGTSKTESEIAGPSFCRIAVEVDADGDGTAPLDDPGRFLLIQPNPAFASPSPETGGKLYVSTSGSMGQPKIAVHSHADLLHNTANCAATLGLRSTDRVAIPVPIYHMYGLGAAFLPSIGVGASVDLQDQSNLVRFSEREGAFDPNVAFLTPGFCKMLLSRPKRRREYRLSVTAGDRMDRATYDDFTERFGPIANLYGSTELGVVAISRATRPELPVPTAVTALTAVEMRLAEADTRDGVGELAVRHEHGFEGYATADGRVQAPGESPGWLETGDLARRHSGDTFSIEGRREDSVNRDGRRVVLADIEQQILGHIAEVQEIAVVVGPENDRGHELRAFCVLDAGANLEGSEIRRSCRSRLPAFALPEVFAIVLALPRLTSGKIDRRYLATADPISSKEDAGSRTHA